MLGARWREGAAGARQKGERKRVETPAGKAAAGVLTELRAQLLDWQHRHGNGDLGIPTGQSGDLDEPRRASVRREARGIWGLL